MKNLPLIALLLWIHPNLSGQTGIYFAGVGAGSSNTTGDDNTFIGYFAGNANTSGNDNSFLGSDSGISNISGSGNSFFGKDSGMTNNTGTENAFFGAFSGQKNSIGRSNTFIGYAAGFSNADGNQNVFLGNLSGSSNINGSGSVFLGSSSGSSNTLGYNNTFLGKFSGQKNETGAYNIALGHGAGPTSSNSNQSYKLYIDSNNSSLGNDDPLIYGEFDNDFVKINGTFEVTAGLSNPSSRSIKNQFTPIDASETLNKLASMNIQQWTYKHRSNEKHIGPVAEEFYELFELGEGNTKISTIDADGVMMLSIQALKKENDDLRNEVSELKSVVQTLIDKLEK